MKNLNIDIDKLLITACLSLMEKQATIGSEILGHIEHVQINGLNVVYFKSSHPSYTLGNRYHMAVFTSLFFSVVYTDSNIIDKDKGHTLEEVRQRAYNNLSHYASKLKSEE